MEILVLFILLHFLFQDPAANDSPHAPAVEVRRYSWGQFHRPIPGDPFRNDNLIDKTQQRVFSEEMSNRNSIENRSRDLRNIEKRAAAEAGGETLLEYRYMADVKNTGDKIILAIYWDYQAGDPAQPDRITHREFRCGVKLKPNETKQMEAFAFGPASRVIQASTGKRPPERVVITRVEFIDGTFWQRPDWPAAEAIIKERGRGGCRAF